MSLTLLGVGGGRSGRRKHRAPELLFQTALVEVTVGAAEGFLIRSIALPWFEINRELERNPDFLFQFVNRPRQFEEFIAGAYKRAGWDEVILTPRSNDGGRDVVASQRGFGAIRFLEQAKAYSPGHLVTHDDVRAMLGVLSTDLNASKCLITTTSDFQPTIASSNQFKPFIPHRLELKNGDETLKWLREIESAQTS
jgi:restriction system protein